jgi:dienelactone hydrolase
VHERNEQALAPETVEVRRPTTKRRTWKRKLVIAAAAILVLLIIGAGALWFLKPWKPKIEITDPGPTGRRVVEAGVFANYFPAPDASGPAVMMLGGSEGGIGDNTTRSAIDLQSKGFSVLTPSYFGAPGQPGSLQLIALETFDRALDWLREQPEVDPDRIAVVGHSKGAEAALLVGTRRPELAAVVASAPSSYSWPGINWDGFSAEPSWTSGGRPLPVLPYGPYRISVLFGDAGRLYEEGLEQRAQHPEAAIAVEDIDARVLLVCGELDALWPACPMSRQVNERAAKNDGPSVRVLAYERAGHRVFGPPVAPDHLSLRRWGGKPADNNAARADAWPKIVDFLRTYAASS